MRNPGRVNMVVRNFRYRYPITSEQVNDMYDEVYWNLVELLGYQNTSGVIAISGEYRELLSHLNYQLEDSFGTSASGVTESLVEASGVWTAHSTDLQLIWASGLSMYDNPYF